MSQLFSVINITYVDAAGFARHSSIAGDPWLRLSIFIMSWVFDSLPAKNKV